MTATTGLLTVCIVMIASRVAFSGMVDLRPDENGDRIGVVSDGKVAYLPARRVNIGSGAVGGGSCRYIRRAANGDLYVTGPGLGLFCSKDGGNTWTNSPLNIPGLGSMGAFTILRNDVDWPFRRRRQDMDHRSGEARSAPFRPLLSRLRNHVGAGGRELAPGSASTKFRVG